MYDKYIWYIAIESGQPSLDREIIAIQTGSQIKTIQESPTRDYADFYSTAQALQEFLKLDIKKMILGAEDIKDLLGDEDDFYDYIDRGFIADELIELIEQSGNASIIPFDSDESLDVWHGQPDPFSTGNGSPQDDLDHYSSRELLTILRQRPDIDWAAAIRSDDIEMVLDSSGYKSDRHNYELARLSLSHFLSGDPSNFQNAALAYLHNSLEFLPLDRKGASIRSFRKGMEVTDAA